MGRGDDEFKSGFLIRSLLRIERRDVTVWPFPKFLPLPNMLLRVVVVGRLSRCSWVVALDFGLLSLNMVLEDGAVPTTIGGRTGQM